MSFNENKYKKYISHLVTLKTCIVLSYFIIFACIGADIGFIIMNKFLNGKLYVITLSAIVGAIIGLILSSFDVWETEKKIQDANWKIDVLKELKNQTNLANKNTIAKTIVSIENNTNDTPKCTYNEKIN